MNRIFKSVDAHGNIIPALSFRDAQEIQRRVLERASPNYVLVPGEFARDINAEITPTCAAIMSLVSSGSLKLDPIQQSGWYLPAFRLESLTDRIIAQKA